MKGGARIPFAGKVVPREHEPVALHGKFVTHPKYGRQFEAASMEFDQRPDADGLANYLASNPDIKGIGPAKARLIAERFGSDFERVLVHEPERIAEVARVPLSTVGNLRDQWLATSQTNAAMTALSAYGLTHHQVTTLVKKLGGNAVGVIQRDPYVIVREIEGFGFKRVDKIARQVGVRKDDANRIRAGILFCVDDALDHGDCWVEYEELLDRANTLLVMDCLDSRERIEGELDGLIDQGVLTCYAADCRFLVARPAVRKMEEELASVFAKAGEANPHAVGETRGSNARLNARQRQALESAAAHSVSLVCGGAGSGKTFCIGAITDLYEANDLRVVLCAPTGKAAKRMEEATGRPASTIHRLLGFTGNTYSRDADHPIQADVLIVDEVSMLDVPLAWRLFQAVDLSQTSVILVGDHNQLPPVGPGNVLRDLIDSKALPTTVLDEVVRQAGILKENSVAILRGQVPKTPRRDHAEHGAWYVIDQHSRAEDVQQFVLDLAEYTLLEKLGFDILRDVQVLTPTHKGPLGTMELNAKLQQLIQRKLWGNVVAPTLPDKRPKLYVNDKVIQTRNNYELGVMNGTMGIVRAVGIDGSLSIEFDGCLVQIEAGSSHRNDIQLAYALTIHKCVSGDTLVPTERGLLPISELAAGVPEHESLPRATRVSTLGGAESTESLYSGGLKPVVRLHTRAGYQLSGSDEHPVLTANAGGYQWKLMPEIVEGDVLVLRRGTVGIQNGVDPVRMPTADGEVVIDERIGWLLGVLVGDGNYTDQDDHRVEVSKGSHDLMLRYIAQTQKAFGVRTTVRQIADRLHFSAYYHSKSVRDLLYRCGLGYHTAADKRVPPVILHSPPAVQAAFLRGLFDTDGGVTGLVVLATASERLAREVQLLLLHHGIVSKRYMSREELPEKNWSASWRVEIMGANGFHLFRSRVGFSEEMKQFALGIACHLSDEESVKSNWGAVPFGQELARGLRAELRSRGGRNYPEAKGIAALLSRVIRGGCRLNHLHTDHLNRCVPDIATTGPCGQEIHRMSELGFFFDRVEMVDRSEEQVYDMSVPGSRSFVGNGVVNHNCQGSEFPCSVVIAHKSHSFQHHRNLLYTGVTRASKTAIIVGDRWGIANCAKRMQVDARKTFLSLLLTGGE